MSNDPFADSIERMVAIPMRLAAEANARASANNVMLRLILQQLVAAKLVDGEALAVRLREIHADADFDSTGDPTIFGASAQQVSDRVITAFLRDLLPQSPDATL